MVVHCHTYIVTRARQSDLRSGASAAYCCIILGHGSCDDADHYEWNKLFAREFADLSEQGTHDISVHQAVSLEADLPSATSYPVYPNHRPALDSCNGSAILVHADLAAGGSLCTCSAKQEPAAGRCR